uniref:SFRICE_014692 n=1 Tax=Spodoptera frugiperda TaxID=7108 RepID=A0A2H1W6Q6_SPOFR
MKIAPRTMPRILKDGLGLAAYKRGTGHFLIDNLKKNRVVKSKLLQKRKGSSKEASQLIDRVQRGHYPTSVMVWWGVSYEGVTEPYFCEKVYQDTILEKVVKPLNITMFNNQVWSFQQDSAPGHKARSTQSWLEGNVSDFIRAEDWLSSSPILIHWIMIYESTACSKRHDNFEVAVKNSFSFS